MNDKIAELIQQLADKLGTTVEHLWGVLAHQAIIENSINLVLWGVFLVATFICWLPCLKNIKNQKIFDDDAIAGFLFLVAIILTVLVTMAGVMNLSTWISALINPEYWALQNILTAIH